MKRILLRLFVIAVALDGVLAFGSSCSSSGETLSASTSSSTLHSPLDSSSRTCVWRFRSDFSGYAVQITFEVLLLGISSCRSNYITIHDGDSASSVQLGRFCRAEDPPIITSSGAYLYMELQKTKSVTFKVTYKAVRLVPSSTECTKLNSFYNNNNIQLNGSFGYLRSPGYPLNYPSSMQCTWTITVPYGEKAELSFNSLNTDGVGSCKYSDHVEVRDGSSSSRSLGIFCSGNPPPIQASGRSLWVRFRSDYDSWTRRGFEAMYYTIQEGTTTNSPATSSEVRAGVIVGVIFGVVALIVIVCLIVCCMRKGSTEEGPVDRRPPATSTTVTMRTNHAQVVAAPKQPEERPPPSQQPGYYPEPSQQPGFYPSPYPQPPLNPAAYPPPPAQPMPYAPQPHQTAPYPMGPPATYPPAQPGPQVAQFPSGQPAGSTPDTHPAPTAPPIPDDPPPPYPGTLYT